MASTLRYAYSKAGRLTALTYADGSVADYVRDTQGRVSHIGLIRPGAECRDLGVEQQERGVRQPDSER